jgi:hypothetical protein
VVVVTASYVPPRPQPTDLLVAAAWIATIPGFTPGMVGERLPPDVQPPAPGKRNRPAPWLKTGFVTVQVVGGGLDPDLPRHNPVISVDCWAAVPGSNDPPWRMAEALGEAVTVATWQRTGFNRKLALGAGGVAYPPAVVQAVYLATGFRRLYDDAADYARVQANVAFSWVTPSLVIP